MRKSTKPPRSTAVEAPGISPNSGAGPRVLSFANRHINALLLPAGARYKITDPMVIVNLSPRPVTLDPQSPPLRPWRSTIIQGTDLCLSESVALLRIVLADNIGELASGAWPLYGKTTKGPDFPRQTPLWISPQDDVLDVDLDPRHFTGESSVADHLRPFRLKLNLWYAPP